MSKSSQTSSRYDARFWLITLSALLVCAITLSLGRWQLDRAAEKESFSQARAKVAPIKLSGQWDADQTLYVDNRQMTIQGQTRQGFFVVTPLLTSATEYVLVERGWIPRDFMERQKLASVETPKGVMNVDVRRVADPAPPAVFANQLNNEHPIVPYIDLTAVAKALPNKAYKGMYQQIGAASEGLERHWFEPASGVEKHHGYAFQWFALSALVGGLYVWFQWIKK